MNKLRGLVLVMTVMAVTAGCGARTSSRVHDSNIVNIKSIQVGDRVAGLLVAERVYLDEYNFSVSFSGRLTLSGEYHHFQSAYHDAPVVEFVLDEASRQKMPHIAEDTRGETSQFTLYPHAPFAPLGSQGTATVVIDRLKLVHRERGETNSARLVRVVQIQR